MRRGKPSAKDGFSSGFTPLNPVKQEFCQRQNYSTGFTPLNSRKAPPPIVVEKTFCENLDAYDNNCDNWWGDKANSTGFTLIETILVVSIFAILGIGTAALQRNVFLLHRTVEDSLRVYNESDKIIQPIANEIRSAQYSAAGAYCIENASSSVLIFYSDIDNDGFAERIRYFAENNIFKKAVIKPSGPPFSYNPANEIVQNLIYNVANANQLFSYYDRNYDGTGSPLAAPIDINQIRMIQITISIDENPNQLPAAVNLETRAFIRNLKDNR